MVKLNTCSMLLLFSMIMLNFRRGADAKRQKKNTASYVFPSEEDPHEGTWLQWPHDYGWDRKHVQRYETMWVEMTKTLHTGERVHVIAYDKWETKRITGVLEKEGDIDMSQIDFYEYRTDDVWVRDNGPIFVFDNQNKLTVQDWRFNGWGKKADWRRDDKIPRFVAWDLDLPLVKVPKIVNEGGSVELDGRGTLMAKRSSILNNNRNPRMTQAQAEGYFEQYLGVTNFIWLDGTKGLEITDDHIDGTARFANGDTIVTHYKEDFEKPEEYDVLVASKDINGVNYKIVHIPITVNNVVGTKWKGLYINYYVANDVVLVPVYNDPADTIALDVINSLYQPQRKAIGVLATELYKDGGMCHCVTQQQPAAK